MVNLAKFSLLVFIATLLAGCAGMGVVQSNDPGKNLAKGRSLLVSPARAVPAEKLIWGAMTALRATKNTEGQADAYLAYAEFLTSPALSKSENYFRAHGFLDKSVTVENRLQKSVEYLDKATPLFFEAKRFDALTDASTLRGVALMAQGKREDACASFDQGVSFHDEQLRRQPAVKASVPEGYGSWREYVAGLQKRAGCAN